MEFHQRGRRTGGNPSQSRPGKYVIERQNGAWIRLSREELREVHNELLRRISAPAPSRAEEIKDSSGEQNDAFHTFLVTIQPSTRNRGVTANERFLRVKQSPKAWFFLFKTRLLRAGNALAMTA